MRQIELLAPAKTALIGTEAIRHGADAVYIGAPQFSARAAAGNSVQDIEALVNFALPYKAKVYVALNTIIKDEELALCEDLIHSLYNIGVDALIVQDMGIFEMNLPPIAIHASTQMNNRTPEKVKFLQDIGCEQVVLARETPLSLIKEIHKAAGSVKLEAFVHGALCVSYSGNCYASAALCGRSANRGKCAQICRLPFDLQDAHGRSLGKKHWLSLKDLNLSGYLSEMIDAGVSSFKIEGRLKDIDYVKNVTAYYRTLLDKIIDNDDNLEAASKGRCSFAFEPNYERTFFRGATTYCFTGQKDSAMPSLLTPKSIGQEVGVVKLASKSVITTDAKTTINNGDGLACVDNKGGWIGFRANKVEGNNIYITSEVDIIKGATLYRNYDIEFQKILSSDSAERKIDICFTVTENGITVTDNETTVCYNFDFKADKAQKPQKDNITKQLSRLGDTIYKMSACNVVDDIFIPSSKWAEIRREVIEKFHHERIASTKKEKILPQNNSLPYITDKIDFRHNVSNKLSQQFYIKHGVKSIEPAFETIENKPLGPLMECEWCIKRYLGACPKQGGVKTIQEPLHLIYKNYYLSLKFNCSKCKMEVWQ